MKKLLLICAVALAGCGGADKKDEGEPIPSQQADAITTQLGQVEDAADRGRCGSAEFQVNGSNQLSDKVDDLPEDVGVKQRLVDGVTRLGELVAEQCKEPTTETEETETETEAPPPTQTQETIPTETETQPTETQPTETQAPTDTGDVTTPNNGGTPPGNGPKGPGPPGQLEEEGN
ncbi:MAG: hypothetical protein H0T15_07195 [Thermoleophilaceae bacterium]|nr:hypothetical protein [Thermoleophilaceae bacterium]